MWVLVAKGRIASLLLVRERSRGILVHVGSKATAIRARDRSGLLVNLGKWCVTIASSPDISGGIFSQRQGSQGLGTAQFQSAVGQERIQYIPPYLSTGQRSPCM